MMTTTPEDKNEFLNDVQDLLGDMVDLLIPEDNRIFGEMGKDDERDDRSFSVSHVAGEKLVTFTIKPANPTICGILIGKKGFTIDSIRGYMAALGSMFGLHFNVWVEQPNGAFGRPPEEGDENNHDNE